MEKLERFEPREAVVLPGFVPDEDLPAVYAGAVLSVLPSLYEGFGLPILESMACGTPLIWASIPANEFLIDKKNGWSFSPGDPKSLSEALHTALRADSEMVWCIGRYNRKWVESNCRPEKIAERYTQIFLGDQSQ